MKQQLYYTAHQDCQVCIESTDRKFDIIQTPKGGVHEFKMIDAYTIAFILEGEVTISCNQFKGVPFKSGEIALWPMNSNCEWTAQSNVTAILLAGSSELSICDCSSIKKNANNWVQSLNEFKALPIRPRLAEFLRSVKNYIEDGITCPYMHKNKQKELSVILRAYYSPDELTAFFLPTVHHVYEFELFIMNNYLKMKGVKEFVDLSGMKLSTFNRMFKKCFNESPYQWLIKQKSKHIFFALTSTERSFTSIAKEYYFTDASHFNRYCKAIFGATPSRIRQGQRTS